jgi:hypothetical protein
MKGGKKKVPRRNMGKEEMEAEEGIETEQL